MENVRPGNYKTGILLLLLTAVALLIHGYHPYAEDAEIYLPGVEKILNPALFPHPVDQAFYASHARMTLFPNVVALSLRVTHLPFEAGLLAWHAASILLLLAGCWQLASILFQSSRARWGAVSLIAALLTIPVAGTALYLMDQYLNPRNLATFAAVFAVARVLQKRYLRALAWIALAAMIHPLMWVFPFSFGVLWIVMASLELRFPTTRSAAEGMAGLGCVLGIPLAIQALSARALSLRALSVQASPAYHEVAKTRAYFYIQNWTWYEWVGILGALALLGCFVWIAQASQNILLARACRAFAIYGAIFLLAALCVDLPPRFEALARLQPMRSLHVLYIFLFVVMGGFLGDYVLRERTWRWLALFGALGLGIFATQRSLFPASAHVEWPGVASSNPWAEAFVWVRHNTPVNAVFALDPTYMRLAGEDGIGFRCLARRSRMADAVKDSGAASMFPRLSETWWEQVQAQTPWKNLRAPDFARLHKDYGVTWVILTQPSAADVPCEYQNTAVRVCRLE